MKFAARVLLAPVLDADGNQVSETDLGSPSAELVFSRDGKKLAACSQSTGLIVIADGETAPRPVESVGECSDLYWSPDGSRLYYVLTLSGTLSPKAPIDTHELKIWNASTGKSKTAHAAKLVRETPPAPLLPAIVPPASKLISIPVYRRWPCIGYLEKLCRGAAEDPNKARDCRPRMLANWRMFVPSRALC